MKTHTTNLKEFLSNLGKDQEDQLYNTHSEMNHTDYNTLQAQLKSISWQLKRIADALEKK